MRWMNLRDEARGCEDWGSMGLGQLRGSRPGLAQEAHTNTLAVVTSQ